MVWASAFTPVPQILLARLPCSACWLTSLCNCLGWRPSVKCSSWGNFSLSALPGHRAAAPQGRCSLWVGQCEVVGDMRSGQVCPDQELLLVCLPWGRESCGLEEILAHFSALAALGLHLHWGGRQWQLLRPSSHQAFHWQCSSVSKCMLSVFLPLPAFLEVLCPLRSPHPGVNFWELRFLCYFRGKGASTCQGCLPLESFRSTR